MLIHCYLYPLLYPCFIIFILYYLYPLLSLSFIPFMFIILILIILIIFMILLIYILLLLINITQNVPWRESNLGPFPRALSGEPPNNITSTSQNLEIGIIPGKIPPYLAEILGQNGATKTPNIFCPTDSK